MELWIDVEDLFAHAAIGQRRMSGIQRFEAEMCRALRPVVGGAKFPDVTAVRFVRHAAHKSDDGEVTWSELLRLFDSLTAEAPAPFCVPSAPAPPPLAPPISRARRLVRRLPLSVRRPMYDLLHIQRVAWRDTFAALRAGATSSQAAPPPPAAQPAAAAVTVPAPEPDFDKLAAVAEPSFAAPGDVVLTAGAAWIFPGYPERVAAMRRHGVRFALLIHDIIPLRRPEWCSPDHVKAFREWLDDVLPQCDTLLTVSHASGREISAYAATRGIVLPHAPQVVPMGCGFEPPSRPVTETAAHLPLPGTYALFVSTLEARKNQPFLVRVWRQLLEELPRERVPTLVLVGHLGGMVADMMQELVNSDFLNGAVRLVSNPSDADLAALYRGCRFTVFPSHYEGWGLPVTESLAFGKPCFVANTTSLPEAGGDLARYFDPLNVRSAVKEIRYSLETAGDLQTWEARIAAEFKPIPWVATAHAIVAAATKGAASTCAVLQHVAL